MTPTQDRRSAPEHHDKNEPLAQWLRKHFGKAAEFRDKYDHYIFSGISCGGRKIGNRRLGTLGPQLMDKLFYFCSQPGINKTIRLVPASSYTLSDRAVEEFEILMGTLPVHAARVSVKLDASRTESEFIVPHGWWWNLKPAAITKSRTAARKLATRWEQERDPYVAALTSKIIETVIWPEKGNRVAAYKVDVHAKDKRIVTYFVSATDGRMLERYESLRTEPHYLSGRTYINKNKKA